MSDERYKGCHHFIVPMPDTAEQGCPWCILDERNKLLLQVGELKKSDAAWKAVAECAAKERDDANRLNGELREALEYAYEALKGYGCDCGTDEPGTCGECYLKAFFKEHTAERPK